VEWTILRFAVSADGNLHNRIIQLKIYAKDAWNNVIMKRCGMNESDIVINGEQMNSGHAITIRVALITFCSSLTENGLENKRIREFTNDRRRKKLPSGKQP
jgi:hypothetical protein